MHQPVPESELVTPQHILGCIAWVDEAVAIVGETLTDSEGIYRASGESLYDAFWRTLCCNSSAEQPTQSPTDDSSYRAWRRLLASHEERLNVETKIRRTFTIRKNISYFVAAAIGIGLTYRSRRHKFLLVAIPLPFAWLTRFVGSVWDAALQILLRKLFADYMQHNTQDQIDQRDFEHNRSKWTQGRQFALTQRGRMGWVPLAARMSDDVGLFAGCRLPFVLRPVEKGYKLMGDAYVHGVMNGEGEGREGEMLPIL
jgi:hypothetical protein